MSRSVSELKNLFVRTLMCLLVYVLMSLLVC